MTDIAPDKTHGFAFRLAGITAFADRSGALVLPSASTLIVSDLHFEKGSAFAVKGQMLPPYDTRTTLRQLAAVIAHHLPDTVIALGDSFHDLGADGRMHDADAETLQRLVSSVSRWIWIEGNHDPGPLGPAGEHMPDLEMGALRFTHIATPQGSGEISGHYHPKATVRSKGRAMSRPAFLIDATRVILPAFGTYTGGLRCSDPVLARLMSPDAIAVLTGARALCLPMGRA